jgi:cell division septal protein FtsQ
MTIDPRLAERRKAVAEDNAVRNVGRLLRFLALLVVVGALVWLALSPWLSINQVRTAGINTSDAHSVLVDHGVVAGTPLILVRPADIEEALTADPWISEARVHLNWPDEVVVRVSEREPVAWFNTSGGWRWRDIEGVALPGPETPDPAMAQIQLPGLDDRDADVSPVVLGAAEFVDNLPERLHESTVLSVVEGEVWATVQGWEVRLGRPVDMAEKARSLVALLDEPLPEGATLILVAPTHPAIDAPETVAEDGGEVEEGQTPDEGGEGDTPEEP